MKYDLIRFLKAALSLPKAEAKKFRSMILDPCLPQSCCGVFCSPPEPLEAFACCRTCCFQISQTKTVGAFQILLKCGKNGIMCLLELLILGSGICHSIAMQRINKMLLPSVLLEHCIHCECYLMLKNEFNTGNPVWVPLGG